MKFSIIKSFFYKSKLQNRHKRCTIDGTGCLYPSSEESSEESGEDSSEEIVTIDGRTYLIPARDDEGNIVKIDGRTHMIAKIGSSEESGEDSTEEDAIIETHNEEEEIIST